APLSYPRRGWSTRFGRRVAIERRPGELELRRLSDFLAEPEEATQWIVEGLLPSAGISIVAAKPKVGKSTLARNLALAVARGDGFLNRPTHSGPVIYLALEEKAAEVLNHFRRMGAANESIARHVGSVPRSAELATVLADEITLQ